MSEVHIPFENSYAKLADHFYTRQSPAQVPSPHLIKVNKKLASDLGIVGDWLDSPIAADVFSGNCVPDGADPLAQVYAGHQFGGYSPQLGDGRAILLGEVLDENGKRFDIQLKGSGRTAFSRGGDGKSALGPVLREYIVSEAMFALGVPTTRALAAVTTGEKVRRQEGKIPGGVFTRVAASHIRVGTFQFFYAQNDIDSVRTLADYAIKRHYSEVENDPEPYVSFLRCVMQAHAKLIAQWMSLGFIHGVMNTDNTSISGETIDYGPCAFMDAFHPQCVFSSIDTGGRYAWGNQPNMGLWNMSRFAETLVPLIDDDSEVAIAKVEAVLADFPDYFSKQYSERFSAKFCLSEEGSDSLIKSGLGLLANQEVDFTVFFRLLTEVADGVDWSELVDLFSEQKSVLRWLDEWDQQRDSAKLAVMKQANPIIIPRNHQIEKAIQNAYAGDYAIFHTLVEAYTRPYVEGEYGVDLEKPPSPDERVRATFCGT